MSNLGFEAALQLAMAEIAMEIAPVGTPERSRALLLHTIRQAQADNPTLSFAEALEETVSSRSTGPIAMPAGYSITPGSADLYRRAKCIQAANPGMGIVDAALKGH